jgi:hypothetical protein
MRSPGLLRVLDSYESSVSTDRMPHLPTRHAEGMVFNRSIACKLDQSLFNHQVVFAEEVRPFKKQQSKTFDRKYKIAFINPNVEEAFRKLLDHTCKLCADVPEYRTFNALKDHMRREHERFYCDLCVDNLKVSQKPN